MRMPKLLLVALSVLALPGCAYAGLAPIVAEAVSEAAGQPRYTGEQFAPAAAEACRGRAARHGRVEIGTVEPHGRNMMRVYGTADGRSFACVVRNDGNIPYFRIAA